MEGRSLALLVVFTTIIGVFGVEDISTPTWSETYYVKGILHIPYAKIHEPIEVWYDSVSMRCRISFYEDMTRTYQLGNIGYGIILKIVPFTTKTDENSVQCLKVEGNVNYTIIPQTVLPSLNGFNYTGKEHIKGISTERWELNVTDNGMVSKYKMFITYRTNPDNTQKIAVPIKYEMHGYNSLSRSHYDYYDLEYITFDDNIPEDSLELDSDICSYPVKLNMDEHLYTFNPMAEFIRPTISTHVDSEFEKFKSKHKMVYQNESEHILRKEIFRQNMRFIHSTNRRNLGYSLATNHLADKHQDELRVMRGTRYSNKYNGGETFTYQQLIENDIPENFDWRTYGAVTPVKDQAVCGSCWSFSAIGAIEGAYFLHNNGSLVRFSEQALLDCSWGYGNMGCDGGEGENAFNWILDHEGIPTDADYGNYLGEDGPCRMKEVPAEVKITGWFNVHANNEDALRLAIFKHGPISVGIDADVRSFTFYSDGIFSDPACSNQPKAMDHAVLVIGYGSINGEKYWLIKNSWSTYWGKEGYMLIASENNICGVMNQPLYVTL